MFELAKIESRRRSFCANGGWCYDAYPELEPLDAGKSVVIADMNGPAVITCFHITQHFYLLQDPNRKAIAARGLILEIYYNGVPVPAVRVPLGDFFADGLAGEAVHFSSNFVEKAPESYNCYIPMPFEKSAKIVLINETGYDLMSYSFAEYESLPEWDDTYGYFHATWSRSGFQLNNGTCRNMFYVEGEGHLIGRSYSIIAGDKIFNAFNFVMEGNNEHYIDGSEKPVIDYLGTEDSFGFSWGFNREYCGHWCGMNRIDLSDNKCKLSIYRFLDANKIRFAKSLKIDINWKNEFRGNDNFHERLNKITDEGGGFVDYAVTHYWYQKHVGYNHEPMMQFEERIKD